MSHVIVLPCIKRANTQNLLFGFLFFVFEVFSSDLIVPSPVNNFKSLKQKYRLVRPCRDVLLVTTDFPHNSFRVYYRSALT